jgi:opacity protein-like surface antigen
MLFRISHAAMVAVVMTLALAARPVAAQDRPRAEIGAGYSAMRDSDADEWFPVGWVADISLNPSSWFGIVGEAGGHYKTIDFDGFDVDLQVHTFMGGARFTARGNPRITPFGQVLAGVARESFDGISQNVFALQPGAGVNLYFSDNVGARLQADFRGLYDKDAEDWMGEARVSSGVVIAIR